MTRRRSKARSELFWLMFNWVLGAALAVLLITPLGAAIGVEIPAKMQVPWNTLVDFLGVNND